MINFIDLFAGTGAFSHVLKQKGCNCVFSNDFTKSSESIYNLNNSHKLTLKDLNDVENDTIPSFDLLCGGFSCQPFSIAGKQLGFKDKRANVFWKLIEIITEHKPRFIILENVKNLKSHNKGQTYITIRSSLENAGYLIKDKILDTCKHSSIPHHRERIYIVGFLNKTDYDNFNMEYKDVDNLDIKNFLEDDIPDKYYYSDRYKIWDKIKDGVLKHVDTNTIYQYRRYYTRENKSGKCPTLTANMGGGGHNVPLLRDDNGIRKLTPRECFNLQGFPSDYKLPKLSDSALYKLAGNAVSIPIVKLIVDELLSL